MASVSDPFVVVLSVSTAAQVALGLVAWRFRPLPGARPLSALMATTTVWAVGSIGSLLSVTFGANVLATQVAYTGIAFAPVAWLFLSLEYADRDAWVSRRAVIFASAVPLATASLAWTNGVHGLLWRVDGLRPLGSFVVLAIPSYGPWFWVHTAYSYLLLAAGSVVFLRTVVHARRIHRYQVVVTLVAVLVPWVTNVAHLSGLAPMVFDPTPFAFLASGALFAVALFRYRLIDLSPIARDVVLEEMDEGVLVLDREDRVVDANRRVAELLELDPDGVVGRDSGAVLPAAYVRGSDEPIHRANQIVHDRGPDERVLNLRASPLYGRDGGVRGRVVIVRDVTVQERQRRELERRNEQLERQNERLEEFAGIVSHDLRNPLTLASAHLDLLDGTGDGEHVDRIADAHAEMMALVDDLLALARDGKVVGDASPVSLEVVVEAAAAQFEREGATVVVVDELPTVEGDPGRLQQLFENLFRNAMEHVGQEVTVRVGALDGCDGIYVTDDGPGIPPDERERVFDSGYTGDSSGTGLGLAIVENIVHAHGWDVDVTDAADGGARFDVTTGAGPAAADDGTAPHRSG